MAFCTLNKIRLPELKAMADGMIADTVTDMDFLETLAGQRCLLVPPWIVQTAADGSVKRIARLIYTIDGEIDKARVLFDVARQLQRNRISQRFGPRFSF